MILNSAKMIYLTLFFSFISLFAADYTVMSTDELMRLRGSVPVEDIEVYGMELTLRVKKMPESDLRKYGILDLIKGQSSASKVGCSCSALKQRPNQ